MRKTTTKDGIVDPTNFLSPERAFHRPKLSSNHRHRNRRSTPHQEKTQQPHNDSLNTPDESKREKKKGEKHKNKKARNGNHQNYINITNKKYLSHHTQYRAPRTIHEGDGVHSRAALKPPRSKHQKDAIGHQNERERGQNKRKRKTKTEESRAPGRSRTPKRQKTERAAMAQDELRATGTSQTLVGPRLPFIYSRARRLTSAW